MTDKTTSDLLYNLVANPSKIIKSNNDSPIAKSSNYSERKANTESPNLNFSLNEHSPVNVHFSPINHKPVIMDDVQPLIDINTSYKNPTDVQFDFLSQPPMTTQEYPKPQEPLKTHTLFSEISNKENQLKKIELLRKLSEIKAKGYTLSKEYSFSSSIDEMEYEYQLLRSYADQKNGVKIIKNGLLQCASILEFLNDKYDPFEFQLSGWSENLSLEVDSWEDIFEELYEKYKSTNKSLPVEVRLIIMICTSAFAFHFSKSYASKIPGLDSLLASNPTLLSKLFNTSSKEKPVFVTPQELNIMKQKEQKEQTKTVITRSPINSPTYSDSDSQKNDNIANFLSKVHNAAGISKIHSETTISDTGPNRPKRGRPPKQTEQSILKII